MATRRVAHGRGEWPVVGENPHRPVGSTMPADKLNDHTPSLPWATLRTLAAVQDVWTEG